MALNSFLPKFGHSNENRSGLRGIASSIIPVIAFVSMVVPGCILEPNRDEALHGTTHKFDIYWPPIAPEDVKEFTNPPLLRGEVSFQERTGTDKSHDLEIVVRIKRPSNEEDRKFWNSQLAFADVPWMDDVRVWDSESRWQWPNLPYLLQRHGVERVDRYGGVDPSKLVDNDFAAVLLREFDATGKVESQSTRKHPLVSAEWRGESGLQTDIHSLVHVASSEAFVIHVGGSNQNAEGVLKLWLIYADFLGSRPPRSWPKEQEWAGGILAYCEIGWIKRPGKACQGSVRFRTPSAGTGFEWEQWSDDSSTPAKSRLAEPIE